MKKSELITLVSQLFSLYFIFQALTQFVSVIHFIVAPPVQQNFLDVFSGADFQPYFRGTDAYFLGQLGILMIYMIVALIFSIHAKKIGEFFAKTGDPTIKADVTKFDLLQLVLIYIGVRTIYSAIFVTAKYIYGIPSLIALIPILIPYVIGGALILRSKAIANWIQSFNK